MDDLQYYCCLFRVLGYRSANFLSAVLRIDVYDLVLWKSVADD